MSQQGNLSKDGLSLSHSFRGYSPTGWSQATVILHAQLGGREGLMQISASFPPTPPFYSFQDPILDRGILDKESV